MRIVVLGELLVEFFPQTLASTLITADHYKRYAGGAPLTFAAVVERLAGTPVLIAVIGDDPFSDYMRQAMRAEGIGTEHLRTVSGKQIGLVFHENSGQETTLMFYRQVAAGTLLGPDDIDQTLIETADLVYFSGTTLQISASARQACLKAARLANELKVPLAIDPNLRRMEGVGAERQSLEQVMALATIITPNLLEAKWLTGSSNPIEIGEKLLDLGPSTVALTMAHEGSYLWHQGEMAYAPGYNVEVIEPTGAGDAFTAALCVGFLHDWPLMKIARYANAAGALAVGAVGHLGDALPTHTDVEILLNHNP